MAKRHSEEAQVEVQIPTPGRVVFYVTEDRDSVPAIVTKVFTEDAEGPDAEGKENPTEVVRMHVCALDPLMGPRNYFVEDVRRAAREPHGVALRPLRELAQEAEHLEPGTWSWPDRG